MCCFSKMQLILISVLVFLVGLDAGILFASYANGRTTSEPEVKPVINVYITIPATVDENEITVSSDDDITINQKMPEIVFKEDKKQWSYDDAVYLAKMAYGESRGVPVLHSEFGDRSNAYQNACAMWTVLNRVDAGWGNIAEVVTAKNQFVGYKSSNPVDSELLNLAFEILGDWSVGNDTLRTLPKEYLYFRGDGKHNYFKTQDGMKYDWSLPDPFI